MKPYYFVILAIVFSLALGCGSPTRNQSVDVPQNPTPKGTLYLEKDRQTLPYPIAENQVILPDDEVAFFEAPGTSTKVKIYDPKTFRKDIFTYGGVQFFFAPPVVQLTRGASENLDIQGQKRLLGRFALSPELKNYTLILNSNEPLGTATRLLQTEKIQYAADGNSTLTSEETEFPLKSKVSAVLSSDLSTVELWIQAEDEEAEYILTAHRDPIHPPLSSGHSFCDTFHLTPTPGPSLIPQEEQDIHCNVTDGTCTQATPVYFNFQNTIKMMDGCKNARCTHWTIPPNTTQTAFLGLRVKLKAGQNALKMIPKDAFRSANLSAIHQSIQINPESLDFIFPQ